MWPPQMGATWLRAATNGKQKTGAQQIMNERRYVHLLLELTSKLQKSGQLEMTELDVILQGLQAWFIRIS